MWWIIGIIGFIITYNAAFVRGVFYGSNGMDRFMNYCDNVLEHLGIKKED
jgi:hypothetical protein